MKRYVKFIMSKGDPITVDEAQALRILNSQNQLLMVLDENGQWTRKTINKAHIVDTVPDVEADRAEIERERNARLKLDAPKLTEEQRENNLRILRAMKERIFGKKPLDISRG